MATDPYPYSEFIRDELSEELNRRRLIDERSHRLVTLAFALATLAVGAVTFLVGSDYVPGLWSGVWLATAVTSVVVAAIFAIAASISKPFAVVSTKSLSLMIEDHHLDTIGQQQYAISWCRIKTLEKLREGNRTKENWLIASQVMILLASALVTIVIWMLIAA